MKTGKDKEERDMLLKSVRTFLTAEGRYRRGPFGIFGNWVGKTDAREQRGIALVELKATVRKITRRKKRCLG